MLDLIPDFAERFGFDPEHPSVTIRMSVNGSGMEISSIPEIKKGCLLAIFDGVPAPAKQLFSGVAYEFRMDEYQVLSVLADGKAADDVPAALVEAVATFLEQAYPLLEEELIHIGECWKDLSDQVVEQSGKDLQYLVATGAGKEIRPGANPVIAAEDLDVISHEGGMLVMSDDDSSPFFPFHLALVAEAVRRMHAPIERAQAIGLVAQIREMAAQIEAAFAIGPDEKPSVDVPDVLRFYPDVNDHDDDAEGEMLSAEDEDGLCN